MSPTLLGVGGAHVDRRGRSEQAFVAGASNPGSLWEDVGGGVLNALRTAVRLGASGQLFSVRGGDAAGESVATAVRAAGLTDLSATYLDRSTPSYTALLDSDGGLLGALADMGLYEFAFPRQMRRASLRVAAARSDAILCDANLPASALRALCAMADGKPVFAIAISPAKAGRLAGVLGKLSCLFMNRSEAAALAGLDRSLDVSEAVERLRAVGLVRAVITSGGDAIWTYDPDGVVRLSPPKMSGIADVTGAGDALAGAATVALLRGAPLPTAVREGMAAAYLAVQSPVAAPVFSPAEFRAALGLVWHQAELVRSAGEN